jgi:hypothetical protein
MTKLLKIFLPPFIGFAVFFFAVRYSTLYFTLKIDEMGAGNLTSFMSYYKFTLPLLFTVGVLTQFVIVIPIWNYSILSPAAVKINLTFDLVAICLVFASGIGYAIWDSSEGVDHLIKLIAFMTSVQLVYWLFNLSTLYLLEQ